MGATVGQALEQEAATDRRVVGAVARHRKVNAKDRSDGRDRVVVTDIDADRRWVVSVNVV